MTHVVPVLRLDFPNDPTAQKTSALKAAEHRDPMQGWHESCMVTWAVAASCRWSCCTPEVAATAADATPAAGRELHAHRCGQKQERAAACFDEHRNGTPIAGGALIAKMPAHHLRRFYREERLL